tara:strand:- start:8352 stop:9698 length:1347 start_codon:yes stop_codon:yes gene_type:complete
MASAELKAFLTKLDQELRKDSHVYRTAVANRLTHKFVYRSYTIRFALRNLLLRSNEYKDQKDKVQQVLKDTKPLITKLTKNIRTAFSGLQGPEVEVKLIRGGVEAIVYESLNRQGAKTDNYAKIFNTYKNHLNDFYQDFLNILEKPTLTRPSTSDPTKQRVVQKAGQAFNLEHIEGSNVEHFINDAVYNALVDTFEDEVLSDDMRNTLEDLGLGAVLDIYKDTKTERVTVTIRSQVLNVIAGGGEEKDLRKSLRKALEKLDIPNLEGSDSIVEANRKRTVKKLVQPFKSRKTLKVTSEDTEIKKGREREKKAIDPSVKPGRKPKKLPFKKKSLRPEKDNKRSQSMFSVMAMINQKLPQTVEKNMGEPGLVNRSGRFANSVRLTDVMTTRKGFPSFGYTYEREPYQVFEMTSGNPRWATPERDPRRVIDVSIRELAAQMAVARFYTRRV